jgi:opacity protein-like surface antigen
MKKYLSVLILCFTHTLYGFNGFYIGGSVGGSLTEGRLRGSDDYISPSISGNQVYGFFSHPWDTSYASSMFAGYGWTSRCFYMGFEGFIRSSFNDFAITRNNLIAGTDGHTFQERDTAQLRLGPWSYGIDARPGFFLNCNTVLYARVGVAWSRLRIQNSIRDVVHSDPFTVQFDLPFFQQRAKTKTLLRLGVGVEKAICSNLTLRTDYVFTDSGRLTLNKMGMGTFPGFALPEVIDSRNLHLRNHELLIGVSYYFQSCGYQSCNNGNPCPSQCPCFGGFYIAGGLGGTILTNKINGIARGDFSVSGTAGTVLQTLSPRHSATAFDGTLSVGYGFNNRCFYGGFEGFVQYARPRGTSKDFSFPIGETGGGDAFSIDVSNTMQLRPWHGGFAFRPGVIVDAKTLLYATIGTSFGVIKDDMSIDATGAFADLVGSGSARFTSSSTHASLRLGGGMEWAFRPCWHLRLDYAYDDYGTLRIRRSSSALTTAVDVISTDARIRFRTHSATLGLARYF